MQIAHVAALVQVPTPDLLDWVARGWVLPAGDPPDLVFAEVDVARIRLVHDLRHVLAIEDDSIALVLSLLDQVHDLRRDLGAMLAAATRQPPPVRTALLAVLHAHRDAPTP